MTTEFNLSEKFEARRKRVNDTCNEYTQAIAHTSFNQIEEDVKEFIKRDGELLKEFENLMLQPNTKSKNFIEISDFLFYLNNFYYKRKVLAGDKLK